MPLFGKRDEAENRFKEAKRYGDPSKKELDLDRAIRLLEDAITLKPHEEKYRKQFEKLKALRSDKAELLFKQVKRYLKVGSSEFDMDWAIRLLEEAVVLRPHEEKYSKQLEKLKGFRKFIGK